ncbi:MAG: DUF4418 family protein [Butyrivibrio sp.]|nr:DUF4418 family protein [Butyrivibrio sp.]
MKNKTVSISTVILGLLAAVGPRTLFPVCSAAEMKMRCYYTANAELVVGILAAAVGAALLFVADRKLKIALSAGVVILGLLILLFPTAITGVCGNPMMHCVSLTKPSLIVIGVLETFTGIASVIFSIQTETTEIGLKVKKLANN